MRRVSYRQPLYLNLRHFLYPGFMLFLFSAPLLRGLFFQADLLPHQMAMGAILAFLVFDVLLTREEGVLRGPLSWGFFLLALSYGVSVLAAASKTEAVRGFLKYLMYFGVFVVSAYLSRNSRGRRALMLTVFLGATVVAAIGVSSATRLFVFPGAAQAGRIMSTLQYPNALAAYLMFSSVIGLILSNSVENQLPRGLIALGTFLQALVFLASYSRGGWVIYPFALIALYLGMPRQHKGRAAFDICAALTPVLLVVRRFAQSIVSESPEKGLWYVGAGFVIALVFYLAQWAFRVALSDRIGRQAGKVLTWAAGMYASATFGLYIFLMLSQHNVGVAGIVPASILNRLSTISIDDPSLLTRAFSTRDAFSIFLKHPLIGGGAGAWNAWYHQYQRVLYWTTEVHNHFAQVLVETGILGFSCYVFVWASVIFTAVKYCLRARDFAPQAESNGSRAVVWGLLVAVLAVGAHSAMDFELSLPGIAVQIWAVFGILVGEVWDGEAAHLGEGRRGQTQSPGGRIGHTQVSSPDGRSERGQRLGARSYLSVVLLLVVAVGLSVPSFLYQRAAWYGGLGASALSRQDFYTAVGLYKQAKGLDPLTAAYSVDSAQAYAAMFFFDRRSELKEKSLSELQSARRLEPYNIVHRTKEIELLISLGEVERALEVSRELTRLVPLDIRSYETLSRTAVIFATAIVRESDIQGPRADEIPELSTVLQEVLDIPDRLESLRSRVTGMYRDKWDPAKLAPSYSLKNYLGQAYYLKGDLDQAISFLGEASKATGTKAEATLWLDAAVMLKNGMPRSEVSRELGEILSYYTGR